MSSVTGGPGQPITTEQYRAGMDLLTDATRLALLVPVNEMREYLDKVETLAPIFEPTAYHRHGGADNLRDQRELLDAAAAVHAAVARIKARLDSREAAKR